MPDLTDAYRPPARIGLSGLGGDDRGGREDGVGDATDEDSAEQQ